MKRFYKLVSSAAGQDGGFVVELDGRPVKTPSGMALSVPTQALADEIVKEWAAQEETIVPDTMPLTQIVTTMQDRVQPERAAMESPLLAYLNTDLLCYRTELPTDLAEKQADFWNPWIDWFASRFGHRLETTTALIALSQPQAAHDAVKKAVNEMNDIDFTALQLATPATGSLVLGLAFVHGDASPAQLFEAAFVEENYKFEIYNEAEHGTAPQQKSKQNAMRRDLDAARKFLDLAKL